MKKMISFLGITAIMAAFIFTASLAYSLGLNEEWLPEKAEWCPDISYTTTFLTKYIWRGQNLGNDPVMQTDLSFSKWGFTLDFWNNYDTGAEDGATELDYTLDYTSNFNEMMGRFGAESVEVLDPLSVSVGYTYYTFPNVSWKSEGFDSQEVYFGFAYDVFLQPSFTLYWDVEEGRGTYSQFGLGHTFDFEGGISADLGVTAGYNHKQWTDETGWSDVVFSGSVSLPFWKYFTVTPSAGYSVILDDGVYNGAQTNEFYGGVSIGFAY